MDIISNELKNKFKKFKDIKFEDLEKIDTISNLVNELTEQYQKDVDDAFYTFLVKQGYKIDKPYNMKQLEQLKEQLAKEDKFLDCIQYTDFEENNTIHHILPFFNSFSCPYTEAERYELLQRFKEINRKEINRYG